MQKLDLTPLKEDLGKLATYLAVAAIATWFQVIFHLNDLSFLAIFTGIVLVIWWKKGYIFKRKK